MYITPFKNQRQKIVSKRHESLLFKEIQYNQIVENIKLQDQLKKSNGFTPFKKNFTLKCTKQNIMKKTATCATFRHGSISNNKFVKHQKNQPSMTSIIDEKDQILISNRFLKTTGQFFKKVRTHEQFHHVENNFIDQKNQERQNQYVENIQTFSSKQELQKKFRENFSKSLDESMLKKKSSSKKLTSRKKNITFLDMKVKSIQNIIHKAGKCYDGDFNSLVEKDQKKITEWGWKSFYKVFQKGTQMNQPHIKEKTLRLKRTAASDHMKNAANQNNPIHKIFVKQKKQSQKKQIHSYNSQKMMKSTQKTLNPNQKGCFSSQNMFKFFNFMKGTQNNDDFSKQISLRQYRQHLQKFYVLRNSQQAIKQTEQYKNMTMGNFFQHNKDQLLTFVYKNENQYKLRGKKKQINS